MTFIVAGNRDERKASVARAGSECWPIVSGPQDRGALDWARPTSRLPSDASSRSRLPHRCAMELLGAPLRWLMSGVGGRNVRDSLT